MPDLLIELFSEEIPARMQSRAAADLKKLVTDGLVEAGLTYAGAAAFSTPRRLTLAIEGLLAESPTTREERKGPKVGAPDKAIEGFLRGAGLSSDDLQERDTPKGKVYFATLTKPGRAAPAIVAEVLANTIRNFPWPKSMRWGTGSLKWVRPLQSILCILTDEAGEAETVAFDLDGIAFGDTTQGHRFMAPEGFAVTSFDDYRTKLNRAFVMLDASERADHIWQDASTQAFAAGLEVVEDKALLSEVAGLVEWPVVLMGNIDAEFLDLPAEVLQTSMRAHQKFFSVKNPKSGRIERFITVANIATKDHGATILAGNQKVLAARLADAKFFWENDLRVPLSEMAEKLKNVTFHNKLGSQADRIERIAALAREIAPMVGADPDLAEQAAQIAKADLSSEMVYEFPELQGLMGRYYAEAEGLPADVAAAAQEHYSPLGPSDDVPTGVVSVAVALADKIDMLTGFWAIDEKPTGSKDPFALRRAALGVIRLMLENGLSAKLRTIIYEAVYSLFDTHDYSKYNAFHSAISGFGDFEFQEGVARGLLSDQFLLKISEIRGDDVRPYLEDLLEAISKSASEKISEEEGIKIAVNFEERAKNHFDIISNFWMVHVFGKEFPIELESEVEQADRQRYIDDVLGFYECITSDLLAFIHDRLKVYLKDKGITHDVIDACLAMPDNDDLTLLVKRAEALQAFLKTDDGENLLQGFKRANNILSQAEEKDGVEYSYGADVKFAETDAEKALFAALDKAEADIETALKSEDFATAMAAMAALRGPIDGFFEAVKINDDNEVLRRNRLNLLSRIRKTCLQAADLTRVEG
jgi:glycyl-tRNA synthetase beta chain